jgi:hypothetical protein
MLFSYGDDLDEWKYSDITISTCERISDKVESTLQCYLFEQNNYETWDRIKCDIDFFLCFMKMEGILHEYSIDVGSTDSELKNKNLHVNLDLVINLDEDIAHMPVKLTFNLF